MVRMTDLQNLNIWLWDRGKLMNRRFVMQEQYQKYLEGDDNILHLKKEEDPYWEPVVIHICISFYSNKSSYQQILVKGRRLVYWSRQFFSSEFGLLHGF